MRETQKALFVVRSAIPGRPILLKLALFTYHAYNLDARFDGGFVVDGRTAARLCDELEASSWMGARPRGFVTSSNSTGSTRRACSSLFGN